MDSYDADGNPKPGYRTKNLVKYLALLALLAGWLALGRVEANAASETAKTVKTDTTSTKKTAAGKWVKKSGYYYYYTAQKKKLTGYKEIGGKYYLFDNKGRQQTGWRKVGKNVRYFKIQNGSGGYMVSNKKVNGVKLDKKGIAKRNEDVSLKIDLLIGYQKLADRLVTPAMKPVKKLEKFFLYARSRPFLVTANAAATKHWDQAHAKIFLSGAAVDCVMAACGFGYLANAVGYKKVKLLLYGHGHCEIDGLVYDPTMAKDAPYSQWRNYFGRTYKQMPALAPYKDRHARYV